MKPLKAWVDTLCHCLSIMLVLSGVLVVLCMATLAVVGTYVCTVKMLGG